MLHAKNSKIAPCPAFCGGHGHRRFGFSFAVRPGAEPRVGCLLPGRLCGKRHYTALCGLAVSAPVAAAVSALLYKPHQLAGRHQRGLHRFYSPFCSAVSAFQRLAASIVSVFWPFQPAVLSFAGRFCRAFAARAFRRALKARFRQSAVCVQPHYDRAHAAPHGASRALFYSGRTVLLPALTP